MSYTDAGAPSRRDKAEGAFRSFGEVVAAAKALDWLLLFIFFFVLLGAYHIHTMLLMGDWDFWIDWKDRRFWPTVGPIVTIPFIAAAQYFFWEKFRLPFGATFVVLGLLVGEWINRYVNFWGWTWFPVNFCFPTEFIPGAIFIDCILLMSRSYMITMIIGCLGYGLLMYPSNWPILAQFHIPIEKNGIVMTLADLMGFETVRTGTPEYIRLVEKGTLRSFGQDVVPVSAFFSGFICMVLYFIWHFIGRWFSNTGFISRI